MVNTVLRVQEGINPSEELKKNLEAIIGTFEIETFDPSRFDFSKPIQDRITSILDAFSLVIEQEPSESQENLKKLHCWALTQFKPQAGTSLDEAELKLRACLTLLVDVMAQHYGMAKEEAVEVLNLAEQYRILQKGRPNHATLSLLTNDASVLQVDQRFPPLSEDSKRELRIIKKTSPSPLSEKHPFRSLPDLLKLFLLSTRHTGLEKVQTDLNALKALIQKKSGWPDHFHASKLDEEQPVWFRELHEPQQRFFSALYDEARGDRTKMSGKLTEFWHKSTEFFKHNAINPAALEKIYSLPFWYHTMDIREQRFLCTSLQSMDSTKMDTWYLPSRLRSIPGLANAGTHQVFFVTSDNTIQPISDKRIRSAHLASRKAKKPWETKILHTSRNLQQILNQNKQNSTLFIGTLVTPPPVFKIFIPDPYLDEALRETISMFNRTGGSDTRTTNHAQNIFRNIFYATPTQPSYSEFLSVVKANAKVRFSDKNSPIFSLIKEYENLLGQTPKNNDLRALYLASLEHVIALQLGFRVHGSCVSGKDRFALLLMMSDSLLLFHKVTGRWPQYADKHDRQQIKAYFVHLFKSQHQQKEANFGAPGAFGLKNLYYYLPEELRQAMERERPISIAQEHQLATYNELREISQNTSETSYARWIVPAQALSRECLSNTLDKIKDVGEMDCWKTKAWSFFNNNPDNNAPEGIKQIREIINQYHISDTPDALSTLGDILRIAHSRVNAYAVVLRDSQTLDFYTCLDQFFQAENPQAALASLNKTLQDLLNTISASPVEPEESRTLNAQSG